MPGNIKNNEKVQQFDRRKETYTKTAVLICRDPTSLKWGPRWLEQAGFLTTTVPEPATAAEIVRSLQPSIVIVDAALRDSDGRNLYETLRLCGSSEPIPTIVLCADSREMQSALSFGHISEVVRKPFDWNLVSRRALFATNLSSHIAELIRMRKVLTITQDDAALARRDLERSLERDELTGLDSRPRFRRLLEQSLACNGADTSAQSLLVVRLNRFRLVNEALGHANGNKVLIEIGNRLRNSLANSPEAARQKTTAISRLGGIRFGILVNGMSTADDVQQLANRILDILCQPIRTGGQSVYLSASIGGAIAPTHGTDADDLLQHAEMALREAKELGGGFRLFRQPLAAGSGRELKLDAMLHEALDRGQLYTQYQPLLQVAKNRVVGAEALLRWDHPVEGAISPNEFIPIAETNGLMTRIGAMVIDSSCRQLREWLDAGADNLRICINLSLYQLRHDDVVEVVERALHTSQLDPRLVEFELSERGVFGRDQLVLRQLHRLKSLGVRLAIDDFGTGDAAIAYLKELPIDALKIDRSYIKGALSDGRDATIAAAMVALGRRLGLTVVAEGVEVPEQLQMLREWGCHQYQGYYFSRAVAGNHFLPLIQSTVDPPIEVPTR